MRSMNFRGACSRLHWCMLPSMPSGHFPKVETVSQGQLPLCKCIPPIMRVVSFQCFVTANGGSNHCYITFWVTRKWGAMFIHRFFLQTASSCKTGIAKCKSICDSCFQYIMTLGGLCTWIGSSFVHQSPVSAKRVSTSRPRSCFFKTFAIKE